MADLIRGEAPTWSTQGAQTAISTGTVLADTGAIGAVGAYAASVIVSVDAAAVLNLQLRNAANGANLKEQRLFYGAAENDRFPVEFRIDTANERLRVIPNANATVNACVSLVWEKLA